ncbi:helix-turn-helix domain-containing protein [Desulfonema magnum]|uniref:HTH domain-containing protein n=1 Tax=Desulfonema magnum TaxID=45655 RepID=A0A975BP40_9BACT|nr:hypothetical protein [Desulfonema magnum]QTA89046.1 HTH domain-containing protein [Desulfonema magnum]
MSVAKKIGHPELYPLKAIKNQEEYEAALISMEVVFDKTEGPLADYAETLSILIGHYEDTHFPITGASGTGVLEFLMEQNDLKAQDLADIFGSETAVSEILHGECPLNLNHIKLLAKHFNVEPATFV